MTAGLGDFSASDSERRECQQRSHLQHGQRWTAEQQQCQQCQRGRADWENSEFQVPKGKAVPLSQGVCFLRP